MGSITFSTIIGRICHELSPVAVLCFLLGPIHLQAQIYRPTLPIPSRAIENSPDAVRPAAAAKGDGPAADEVQIESACDQEIEGPIRRVNCNVRIETVDFLLNADGVNYNEETRIAEARGNVRFRNLMGGETLTADYVEFNVKTNTGKFYNVTGSAPARIDPRPGLLTTTNPFFFSGEWAEKMEDRYILHNGFLTDCKPEDVWWRLKGKTFDVIPQDRAIARGSWLYVKKVPIFYTPIFYKSLEEQPRRSGFLTPNIGNSSLRGRTLGVGYFWAINRSYDATYRGQYYTQRGFAHQADVRGVVNPRTNFSASIFGMGEDTKSTSVGGYVATGELESDLGRGWLARGELRNLSSFRFRQEFTQSFDEAINSETHSVGVLTKHWRGYGVNLVAQRNVNYQTNVAGDEIVLRKLPEFQFTMLERAIGKLPVYVSLDSSFGLQRRSQPLFQTRQLVQRTDFAPRVMTALHWKGVNIAPSFGIRQTFYDSSTQSGRVSGQNLVRFSKDVAVDLTLPSLTRIFVAPKWMRAGDQIKHVIEPRATYRYASGINDFSNVLRFDEVDLASNTHEVEFSLTNRILSRGGQADLLSWQLWYKRYFDPTFGGAVVAGRRNVVESAVDLTGYAFLNGPRHQSPVVSVFRVQQSRVGVEWRADYDPSRRSIVNSGLSIDTRMALLFISAGHYQLRTDPILAPNSNQFRGTISYGNDNRQGWNYGVSAFYDYRIGSLQYVQSQATYNTDCCGISVQYRRFNFNVRGENQFRVAFALSNIGSFGTLRQQERIF